ncbi:MAG: hypothetical protein QGM50_11315 [Anaerolineae bacterium]|nr:hypothetical protein [Anaerolineae bacterium]
MNNLKEGFRYGLISYGIILYLNLLGIPLNFGDIVLTIFSLLIGLLSFAFLRKRPNHLRKNSRNTLVQGLIIGLVSGLGLSIVTYIFASLQKEGINVAQVFAQIKPEHTGALTGLTKEEVLGDVSVLPGLLKLTLLFTFAAFTGSALTQLPVEKLRKQFDSKSGLKTISRALFVLPFFFYGLFMLLKIEGVQIAGTEENNLGMLFIFLFIGAALFALRAVEPGRQKSILVILLVVLMLLLPHFADLKQNAILGVVGIFIVMGIGLNIVVGYAGLLDLGYVAFFAVGAYAYALLSSPESYVVLNLPGFEGVNFWAGLPIAIIIGAFAGFLLGVPVLRMRGDYLAIVTLGFGEIARLLVLNLRDYTGGPGGVINIPAPILFGMDLGNPRDILYIAMAFGLIVTFFTVRLRDSRLGRAWIAMREDEDVAQAMGINLVAIKLLAFASGAAIAGMAGALYATRQVNIFPDNFALDVSINVLSLIIIGGIGSLEGVVLGAIVLIGLPEILRTVDEYRIVAFGALLVTMMIVRPEGILPSTRRKRTLHVHEDSESTSTK